jgi:hypothetical protein
MMRAKRTVLAFVVAPFCIPFVFLLFFLLTGFGVSDSAHTEAMLFSVLLSSAYALPIAYLFELVLGIALWKTFKRYGIRSLLAFAAAGAVMGWLFFIIAGAFVMAPSGRPFWIWLCICTASGVSPTLLFRAIAFSGRPVTPSK